MEHLSNNHGDGLNQDKKSHNLCNEKGHPVLSLIKGQWKLRQSHDQNFRMDTKPYTNTSIRKNK